MKRSERKTIRERNDWSERQSEREKIGETKDWRERKDWREKRLEIERTLYWVADWKNLAVR